MKKLLNAFTGFNALQLIIQLFEFGGTQQSVEGSLRVLKNINYTKISFSSFL